MLKAIFLAYPDRVAQRREARSERLLLASGSGATLARESGVRDGEFLVALELAGTGGEALVRMASRVEREWLMQASTRETVTVGTKIVERAMYGAIVLHEQTAGRIAGATQKPERPRFDGPEAIDLPSGRRAKLEYRDDGSIFAAVKLQELFGLAETPRVGPRQTPVTFELLAPNGRPVQVTRDLRSFWNNAYQQVRKELRARYPRHPWPEDPWSATPTHRTKRR